MKDNQKETEDDDSAIGSENRDQSSSKRVSLLSVEHMAESSRERSLREQSFVTTQSYLETRAADGILAAGGAAGSLTVLQLIQDYLLTNTEIETPIVGPFLIASAIKLFLNQSPPSLDAFYKDSIAGLLIGSSIHIFLWAENVDDGGAGTIVSGSYILYLILFFTILFWKLNTGSIWGSGISLAYHVAFQSGFWGKNISVKGDFRTLIEDFPLWYILSPYLISHFFLYFCALGVSRIRQQVRIFIMRKLAFSSEKKRLRDDRGYIEELKKDKEKLRRLFDRMDTSGDGRLDAMELKLALRAAIGADLSLEDCDFMIKSADSDGDGSIDFEEFFASVDQILLL